MKTRRIMATLMGTLAVTLAAIGVVGSSVAAPPGFPLAKQSQHAGHEAADPAAGKPAPTTTAAPVTRSEPALPEAVAVEARSNNGKQQSLGEALKQPHGQSPAQANSGGGSQQSLGEALRQPHGIAVAGVTPEGKGVNNGTTKQAPGLKMRELARGEQDAGINDAARTGGCAPGYGDGRSCLPVAPPSAAGHAGHGAKAAWTCEELLTLFPQGIPLQVRGTDPLGLDKDGNGIACA